MDRTNKLVKNYVAQLSRKWTDRFLLSREEYQAWNAGNCAIRRSDRTGKRCIVVR